MAVPVELEIFMKDLTKAGLQSVGKNVDDVENQTQKLISALKQVIAEQKKQLEVNKIAGLSYTQEVANIQALTESGQAVLGRQRYSSTPWLTERHGYDPT